MIGSLWAAALSSCGPAPPEPAIEPEGPPLDACARSAVGTACAVLIEAEDFDGIWNTQNNLAPYHGSGFRTSNASGVASEGLQVSLELAPGRYAVWARGFADGADRSFRLTAGGSTLAVSHGPTDAAPGFLWVRTGTVVIGPSGAEVAVVVEDRGSAHEAVDAVLLTNVAGYDPGVEEARWRVLDRARAEEMLAEELSNRARRYAEVPEEVTTSTQWNERAARLRPKVRRALGLEPLPERTPLAAEVAGVVERDGYRIERVRYESRPGMIVTANVFVPDGAGPFPAVISPIGHYLTHGKADHRAAARNHALARLGFVALVYDAFGQGERKVDGMGHGAHWQLALSGHGNLSLMVWDTIRAFDYLETRDDVDPTRVAITGASGGGLNTLFASAIDERFALAAPAAYVTAYEAFFEARQPHDPCTFVPGVAGVADMGEIAALFGPKPQLWLAGSLDQYFPIEGTEASFEVARARYGLLGAEDALRLATVEDGHAYGRELRESFYGFVARELTGAGDGAPIPEPELDLPDADDPALWVFESGRVPEGTTAAGLAKEWAEAKLAALPVPTISGALRSASSARLVPRPEAFDPEVEEVGIYETVSGTRVKKLLFRTGAGIELPAFFHDGDPAGPVVVVAGASGLETPMAIEELMELGASILMVWTRGRGETLWDEYSVASGNLLLGDSILGQRATDLYQVRRALERFGPTSGRRIGLVAVGLEQALEAVASQALHGAYDAMAAGPLFGSYREAFAGGLPLSSVVFDLLEDADVAHLVLLASTPPTTLAFREGALDDIPDEWRRAVSASVHLEPRMTRRLGVQAVLRDLE